MTTPLGTWIAESPTREVCRYPSGVRAYIFFAGGPFWTPQAAYSFDIEVLTTATGWPDTKEAARADAERLARRVETCLHVG